MKNLTLYYIKKRLPLILIVLGITLVGLFVYFATAEFYGIRYYYEGNNTNLKAAVDIFDTGINDLTVIALILAVLIPIYEFSFKMKKTGCDLFYSLPIKRNKLYMFKYIFGICEMVAILLINFFTVFIFMVIKLSNVEFTNMVFNPGYYFLYLIVIIILAIIVYSWIAFFYTRANTFFDGLISVAMSSLVLLVIVYGIKVFGENVGIWEYGIKYTTTLYSPFGAAFRIASIFESLIEGVEFEKDIVPSIVGISITAISIPLFVILCGRDNAEDSEDISNSIFIYKSMLPIFIVSTFMMVNFFWGIWAGIIIAGYIGYVIYNRNFKLKKYDWISYGVSVGIGIILMVIATVI